MPILFTFCKLFVRLLTLPDERSAYYFLCMSACMRIYLRVLIGKPVCSECFVFFMQPALLSFTRNAASRLVMVVGYVCVSVSKYASVRRILYSRRCSTQQRWIYFHWNRLTFFTRSSLELVFNFELGLPFPSNVSTINVEDTKQN